jgi:hypothetical protein
MHLIHRLAQVTQDPIVQGASPVGIAGKGRHEDGRNGVARVDKPPAEFEAGHGGHMDVSDQASCFGQVWGREKFGCRRKNVDGMTQRSHEPAHGLTKEAIIIDNRNQYLFHHAPMATRRTRHADAPTMPLIRVGLLDLRQECHRSNADAPKLWLTPATTAKLGGHGL